MSSLERNPVILSAPRYLVSDAENLWVADTGHHRVLGASLDGCVHTVIGAGARASELTSDPVMGLDQPLFVQPMGLATTFDNRRLFVADVGNDTLWRLDRDRAIAQVIAGNGASDTSSPPVSQKLPSREAPLHSPSALALDESAGILYLAMARSHQIWSLHLESDTLEVLAGHGMAGYEDGCYAEAAFHEPRGLALAPDRRRLYVADAGNAALRVIDLVAAEVGTVLMRGSRAKSGPRGPDRDPIAGCIAVTSSPGGLVIVDDALRSIRGVNVRHATATPGLFDGQAHGARPTAVAFDRQHRRFIVADAARHRLLRLSRDLDVVEELPLYRPVA